MANNLAAFQTVLGQAKFKLATESNYVDIPGDSTLRLPNQDAPSNEVVGRGGLTSIVGHSRFGTFELTIAALLPHHPAIEKLKKARDERLAGTFHFEIPERAIATIADAINTASPATKDGEAGEPGSVNVVAAKASEVDSVIAPGHAFKLSTAGVRVVDSLTHSATGVLTAINIVSRDNGATPAVDLPTIAAAAEVDLSLVMPKLTLTGVAVDVLGFNEGEADAEGTLTGGVRFQQLAAVPAWITAIA